MRSSLIYLLLVGVPLAALIGVMHLGERIVPPAYVGGVWLVEADSLSGCRPPSELEIVQSGIVLDLYLGEIRSAARMKDDRIRSSPHNLANGCAGEWQIDARVVDAEHLAGSWVPVECDTCSAIAFTAEKAAGVEPEER